MRLSSSLFYGTLHRPPSFRAQPFPISFFVMTRCAEAEATQVLHHRGAAEQSQHNRPLCFPVILFSNLVQASLPIVEVRMAGGTQEHDSCSEANVLA